MNSSSLDKRIPVLVISGFLGSGKTTLLSYLLKESQAKGARIAVVSNEFGALGIDRALLGQGGEAYVELEGGCVCCQLSDELVNTLQMLWERVYPDGIIVETSGVALPFDTQLQVWREPVCRWVDDDMAVVVVNAEQLFEQRDLDGTFEDQVSSADLLLLNKIDLVPPQSLAALEVVLHRMAPDTPVVHAIHGQVDPLSSFHPSFVICVPSAAPLAASQRDIGMNPSCRTNLLSRMALSPRRSSNACGTSVCCAARALCEPLTDCDWSRVLVGASN